MTDRTTVGAGTSGDEPELGTTVTGSTAATAPSGPGKRRKLGWIRRHKVLVSVIGSLIAVAVIGVAGVVGYDTYNQHKYLGQIGHVTIHISGHGVIRPKHTGGKDLNILVAGADDGTGPSISQDIAHGTWHAGQHRSDTIMVVHITAARKHVYVMSIPRDSWVTIYDGHGQPRGKAKVNAAFSLYGPAGYVSTIEHLTGLRMDHLGIMDWKGFKDLTTALGGVKVYIPHSFYDDSQRIEWHKGYIDHLEGAQALAYVRTRHGLTNGDFGRIQRQQNFIRAVMDKLLGEGITSNPLKLKHILQAIGKYLIVEQNWKSSQVRDLAAGVGHSVKSSDNVTFLTAPLGSYATLDGQSVVELNTKQCNALWNAAREDRMHRYVVKYGKSTVLPGSHHVH